MLDRLRSLFDWFSKPAPGARAEQKATPARRAAPGSIAVKDLDPDAVKIIRRLTGHKHRAYLVGGCVRDLLLGYKPKDFDIGTSATPGQIKRLFRNCRIIGRRFRLAHIYFQGGKVIEVATFRSRETGDDNTEGKDLLIRDDNVFGTPQEDALRRDFTINALFYDLGAEKVIDYAEGLGDLERGLVRTIGDPGVRFREDPIRMLRAVKFASRLNLVIEKQTLTALKEHRHDLDKAATPRILEEINRFCREGSVRQSFEMLFDTGLFDVIFPEFARAYRDDSKARELLLALIHPMDPRGHHEVHIGEFFAALLLPLLIPGFGWRENGTTSRTPGYNLRSHVEEVLRPLAQRLRIPRREQEYCRQLLGTLFRMVPHDRVRRQAKQAIMRRECLTDALRAMDLLGKMWGGEFAAASKFWSSQEKVASVPRPDGQPDEGDEESRGPRRRRRRGGRRRRGEGGGGTTQDKPAAARSASGSSSSQPAARPARPARPRGGPRDDNSFFAALPSLPEDEAAEAEAGDRYGALNVGPQDTPAEATATEVDERDADGQAQQPASEGEEGSERRPRRRRRRRRRPRKAGSGEEGGEATDADESGGSGESGGSDDAPASDSSGEGEE